MPNVYKIEVLFSVSPQGYVYWTHPKLLERWSYPDGMTLKVPRFDAKVGGQYRFEHTGTDGVYVCTGYFKGFIPNEKLVQVDNVKDPTGNLMFENLESTTEFKTVPGGTEIYLYQTGFLDEASLMACEEGWTQSLDNLSNLLTGGLGTRPGVWCLSMSGKQNAHMDNSLICVFRISV